jgi:hypothetical protein
MWRNKTYIYARLQLVTTKVWIPFMCRDSTRFSLPAPHPPNYLHSLHN